MVGPGWGPAQTLPVNGIYHGPIRLPMPINTVYVGFGNQKIVLRPSPWCNPSVFFTEDEQEANWIFAHFGRSRASNFWEAAGTSKCHAAVLDELICEMVTSGAMTNEGWEFSAALSGRNSIPDGSGALLWYASTSSVCTETKAAWPESWTVFCTEMRSFQCRCFWNMLPDDSVLSQSFKQAGWDVALSLDTNLNPDFNFQNPFFFRCGCGFSYGKKSSTTEFAFLRCCNPGQVGAIATASERVLDLDTIAIQRIFCGLRLMFSVSLKTLIEL